MSTDKNNEEDHYELEFSSLEQPNKFIWIKYSDGLRARIGIKPDGTVVMFNNKDQKVAFQNLKDFSL